MPEGLGYTSVAISYICFKNEILLIMIIIKEIAALFDFVPCCYTFQMVLHIRGRASWSRRSVWYTPRRRSGVFFSSSFLLHDICFNCSENAVHIGGFYFMRLRAACYSGTPPYDHPVYKTTSLLRPYSFKPNVKNIDSFIILKTPLMRPPRHYDENLWPNGGHINGVPLYLWKKSGGFHVFIRL